ncbi:MAG: hypothetical protein QF760_00510 [Candidatus Thalassarchaeaceae archaeon]|nr:hypothetical protein [Candidatus Thalassarchaeaceae archaeon]MDP6702998.1 hypothetical protein [Candidatus Thalassarchaeaceae archaeon]MDP7004224.1 hypothetical protein [Candidatus Thalassarchaeaceae archaeon]
MSRPLLLVLILLAPMGAGCIEVPTVRPCPDDTCFPLTSDAFNDLISQEGVFDVLALASENERLRVRTTMIHEQQGQRGEIHWDVAKDDVAGLRSIATRVFLGGNPIIDSELIEGQETTNVRVGGTWYEGRDASPDYVDPFFDLAQKATENPDGIWPPFAFDTTQLSGLSWTITGDAFSTQQVASASNGTHDFIIELMGLTPAIIGIEVYSGDSYEFTLGVSPGDEVEIELQQGLPRMHLAFVPPQPDLLTVNGDARLLVGIVPEGFTSEVSLSEIEIHAMPSPGQAAASMRLDADEANHTAADGTWWSFIWIDVGPRGLFSAHDAYYVRTNSTADFTVAFYDLWAEAWTDQSV